MTRITTETTDLSGKIIEGFRDDDARFVILWRTQRGGISFVSADDGVMATWSTREAAEESARNTTVCRAFPYQIVEVDI